MAFLEKKSKKVIRSVISTVLTVVVLLPSLVSAYQIVDDNTLRIMPSIKVSTSSNFQVRDRFRVEPQKIIVSQNFKAPVVAAPVPQAPDGSEKYDASAWLLARTYDELVQAGQPDDGPFLASAPEQTKIMRPDPVLNQPQVTEAEAVPTVETEIPEPVTEDVLVTAPVKSTQAVVLQPVKTIPAKPSRPAEPSRIIVKKLYTAADLPLSEGLFKMSAPAQELAIYDESCEMTYKHFVAESPWKWVAYKLMFFVKGMLIVIYLLVLLVFLMWVRKKRGHCQCGVLALLRKIKKIMF